MIRRSFGSKYASPCSRPDTHLLGLLRTYLVPEARSWKGVCSRGQKVCGLIY